VRKLVTRAGRYAVYGAGAVLVAVAAAALLVPAFLDMPAMERELKAKLSQALNGEIAWEKLSIRLLPSPRGSLSKVRAEIPGVASVRAEQLDAHLRLLPLLHGRAEIASVSLSKPEISLDIGAPSPAAKEEPRATARRDPVESYRGAVEAIRRFAPDAVVEIEDAGVDVRVAGMPQVRVRALDLRAHTGSEGIEVELTAEGDAWSRFKLSASVAFADLSGTAHLEADLKPQAWLDRFLAESPVRVALPAASVRANARTDGKTRLECDFDLRAASVELLRAAERVRVTDVAVGGKVAASDREIVVSLGGARLGASRLAGGSLRYALNDDLLASTADFDLDLAQVMDASRRLAPEAAEALARFAVSGRAQGQAKFETRRSGWNALVDIRKSDSSVVMEGLPGPVMLAGAAVSLVPGSVKIDRADVTMLDARALASATISYGKQLRIEGTVPEGSVGENLLAWVWKKADAPPHLALKTPIAVAVQRAAWSPRQPLDLAATASFGAGPRVAVDLGWAPEILDIRSASVKDARSDAVLALRLEKRLLQGRFSGSLQSASIAAMLKGAKVPSGGWTGDLRVRVDLDHPQRFSATGKLAGESVDLAWLLERPVTLERADVQADGQKLRIRQASVNWAQQHFALRGELARAADGAPIIDVQIESPGVVVDALLARTGAKPAVPPEQKPEPAENGPLWTLWPLPARGRIAFQSKFVQYGERKAEPVAATLTLEAERAFLELQQVQLCGVSFPLTAEARPKGVLSVSLQLVAQKQQLEQTARCLTERGVEMTGEFDLRADVRTQGTIDQLTRNLVGTVSAEAREGRVKKFPLILNILSAQNVRDMMKRDVTLEKEGFPYRVITTSGRFGNAEFALDESFFRSDIIGFAAKGSISLLDEGPKPYDSKLTVLVAPLGRLDQLVRRVPVLGYLLGGTLTSVPVDVSGDIRKPRVVPLAPGAVLGEVAGIFERALKLPGRVLPQTAPATP